MAYKRKTKDEWEIQSYYDCYGYETVTVEETFKEAREQLKCYRENEPHVSHRMVCKRIKIEE